MKLLIPTDFSNYADFALQMGINLAVKNGAEIHLLHAINYMTDMDKMHLGESQRNDLHKHIERWSQEKLELLQRQVGNHGLTCKVYLRNGPFLTCLKTQLEEYDYDVIVMGSHGASGKEEWFIGSNTSKAVRKLHSNILVVKNATTALNISEVVFVTGLYLEERNAWRIFLDFIKAFEVKAIHILAIDTTGYYSQPTIVMNRALSDFVKIGNDQRIKSHFYPDFSIQDGIKHFTEEYDIDLIGISNFIRSPIKRIFSGSNVEMLVNHSDVPVLSIDYKKT